MSNLEKGKQYYQEESYVFAINEFSKHLARSKDSGQEDKDAEAFYWRALSRFKIDSFEQAIIDLDSALKLRPEVSDFYYERGMNRLFLMDKEACIKDFDKAVSLDKDNPFRYASRAFVKAKFEMLEEAIEDYHKALDLDPEDIVAQNNLGMLYEKLGFRKKAKEFFDKADNLAGIDIKRGQVYKDEDITLDENKDTDKDNTDKEEKQDKEKKTEKEEPIFRPVLKGAKTQPKTKLEVIKGVLTSRSNFAQFLSFWKEKITKPKK